MVRPWAVDNGNDRSCREAAIRLPSPLFVYIQNEACIRAIRFVAINRSGEFVAIEQKTRKKQSGPARPSTRPGTRLGSSN